MTRIRVLSVASEIYPLIKTGGLADVAGALPAALAVQDVVMRTVVPGYPAVLQALGQTEPVHAFADLFGGSARLLAGRAAGLDLFAIDAPHLFARSGNPYAGPDGRDWPDNAFRFAALGQAAAEIGRGLVPGFVPDVVHAHDWQAGLAPAYLHYAGGERPGTVMTVHNLAFQGQFPADLLSRLGLPSHAYAVGGVEYYGSIGYLKAGLQLADRITTVSPTYAIEIRSPAAGMGLDGLLRARAAVLSGIRNGIDVTVWDPSADPALASKFDAKRLQARAANKAALQTRLRLTVAPDALLFGVVSRLAWQKGMDLLLQAIPILVAYGAQLVLLGSGDRHLEDGFAAAAAAHPGRIGVQLGYDEALAHLIQCGSDAILVPSRFEPCGLTQLCALRYGALPVVARVGGLCDTVIDANEMALAAGVATGIQFAPVTREGLETAIERAAALWQEQTQWLRLQRNGMLTEVGWQGPAHRYASLYRGLVAASPGMSLARRMRLVAIGLLGLMTAGMVESPSRPTLPQLPNLSPGTGANPEATPPANPGVRSDKPILVPTRDVAVTWTVQLTAGGPSVELTEYYSVAQSKRRDNYPGGSYWITDIAQDRVLLVFPAKRLYYASSAALRFSTMLPKETSFRRGSSETIAGMSCTQWRVAAPDGYRADVCMTDDGVLLRLSDDTIRRVAMKVIYGPQDPILFAAPADFAKSDLPPLGPLHDAVISYRGEHVDTDGLKEDVFARNTTVAIAVGRRMARFEGKTPDYLIVDDGAHRATRVSPTQKTYQKEVLTNADRPALLYLYAWPIKIAGRAKFTRAEEASIAGLSCTTWHVRDETDNPWFDVCVSDDGLILRFAGMRSKDAAAIEAIDVLYGPPPGSLFTVPADFQEAE